jgi:hypothetical protein
MDSFQDKGYEQGLLGVYNVRAPITNIDKNLYLHGNLTQSSFKQYAEQTEQGEITTFTAQHGYVSKVTYHESILDTALTNKMIVYGSNHKTTGHPIAKGVQELPAEPYAKMAHFKGARAKLKGTNSRLDAIFTSDMTPTNVNDRVKNKYIVVKDHADIAKQNDAFFTDIRHGKAPRSQRDLLVFSPTEDSGRKRLEYAFFNNDKSNKKPEPLYMESATYTSDRIEKLIYRQLASGGDVHIKPSGMNAGSEGQEKAQNDFISRVQNRAANPDYPGYLYIHTPKSTETVINKRTGKPEKKYQEHQNDMFKGNIGFEGSIRGSTSAYTNMAGTESGWLFQSDIVTKELKKDFEEGTNAIRVEKFRKGQFETGFINYVHTSYMQESGQDVLIPSQLDARNRTFFEDISNGNVKNEKGILTSAYTDYQRLYNEKSIFDGLNSYIKGTDKDTFLSEYKVLSDIQNSWVTSRTWGESWGQLGGRGFISTSIINLVQRLNDEVSGFDLSREEQELRFTYGYRLKPVKEHSTTFADITRSFIDFNNNMIGNMMGFQLVTGGFSLAFGHTKNLLGFVSEVINKSIPENNKIAKGASHALTKALPEKLGGLSYIMRSMAAESFGYYMSPILRAIDTLTGMSGSEGSLQRLVDRVVVDIKDPSKSTEYVTKRSMVLTNKTTESNILFSPFRFYNQGLQAIYRGSTYLIAALYTKSKRDTVLKRVKSVWSHVTNKVDNAVIRKNPHLFGFKASTWGTAFAVTMFAAVAVDQLTGYLGQNLGGVDARTIDRGNEILRNAAERVGMHPVQLARTTNSNVYLTGNRYIDAAYNLIRALTVNPMKELWRSAVESLTKQTKPKNILSTAIMYQGKELELAQTAAMMGNQKLANYYLMASSGGQSLYEKDTFKADLWKSWAVQITATPIVGTLTWGMSQHSGAGDRGGFGYNFAPKEVQEFGFSLQGPVFLAMGVSSTLPFQMYKALDDKEAKQLGYSKSPWVFTYKPGTNFANALGAVTLLHAFHLSFNSALSLTAHLLDHSVAEKARAKAYASAPFRTAVSDALKNVVSKSSHAYMVSYNHTKSQGGARIRFSKPMSHLEAINKIMSIPVTLPIHAAIAMVNAGATLINYGFTVPKTNVGYGYSKAKNVFIDALKADTFTVKDVDKLAKVRDLLISGVEGTRFSGFSVEYTRNEIKHHLESVSGGVKNQMDFENKFGVSNLDAGEKKRLYKAYLRLTNPVLNFRNVFSDSYNHSTFASKFIRTAALVGSVMMLAGTIGLTLDANNSVYNRKELESSLAFRLANAATRWAASGALLNRADAYARKQSTLHKYVEDHFSYDTGPDLIRSLIAIARMGAHLFDYQGNFRNLQIVGSAMAGELLYGIAGFKMDDLKFDPGKQYYKLKEGAFATPSLTNTVSTWATGILSVFNGSFYNSLETHPYLAAGPYGVVQKKIDKDTYAWAGGFVQLSPMMFLNAGYAEQPIFRTGYEKRRAQESKYMQHMVYDTFGLRQSMRVSPIRSSKMYRDDIMADATTWSVRLELLRRSTMFSHVKRVDPMDLVFIPGLVSHQHMQTFASRHSIRIFRDSNTREEDNLSKVMNYYVSDVFSEDSKNTMEELASGDEEIQYNQGVYDQKVAQDYFNRKYYNPLSSSYNFWQSPQVAAALVTTGLFGALGTIGMFTSEASIVGGAIAGAGVAFMEKIKIGGGLKEALRLKQLRTRSLRTSVSRLIKINHTQGAGGSSKYVFSTGSGKRELIYVKGERYRAAPPNGASTTLESASGRGMKPPGATNFGLFMWDEADFISGELKDLNATLNRISAVEDVLKRSTEAKGIKFIDMVQARDMLHKLENTLDNMAHGPLTAKATELQARVSSINKAKTELDNMMKHMIEDAAGDKTKLERLMEESIDLMQEIHADNAGKARTITGVLFDSSHAVKDLQSDLINALEDEKVIEEVGPLESDRFRRFLKEKLGFTGRNTRDALRIAEYEMAGGVGKNNAESNKLKKPGWVKKLRLDFERSVISQVVSQVAPKDLTDLLDDADFMRAMSSNTILEDGSTREKKILEILKEKMGKDAFEENIEKRLSLFRRNAFIETGLTRLLTPNVGAFVKGTFTFGFQAWFVNSLVADPIRRMSYLKSQLENEDLNMQEKNYIYTELYKERQRFIGGMFGEVASQIILNFGTIVNFFRGIALLAPIGGPVGLIAETAVGLGVLGVGIAGAIGTGLLFERAAERASRTDKIREGREIAKDNYMGGILNSWFKNEMRFHDMFENMSKTLTSKKMRNRLEGWEVLQNWALNESPIREAIDIIYREDKNPGTNLPYLSYRLRGGSPSLDQEGHGAFVDKSVFWVGNELDYGVAYMAPVQNLLPFQDSDAYNRYTLHSSIFGYLPSAKQVTSNKDGSDALGPTWMRGDYRSHMFRPPNLVQNAGVQAEMLRRADLMTQVVMNLTDQGLYINKIFSYSSAYDPRSGVGMPPRSFLVSVIDPSRFGRAFTQTKASIVTSDPTRSEREQVIQQARPNSGYIRPRSNRESINDAPPNPINMEGLGVNPNQPMGQATDTVSANPAPTVRTAAREVKGTLASKVQHAVKLAAVEKAARESAKSETKKTKGYVMQVAASTPEKIDPHELHAEPHMKQSKHNQFGERLFARTPNGVFLSSTHGFEKMDKALMNHADTYQVGSDRDFNDTFNC